MITHYVWEDGTVVPEDEYDEKIHSLEEYLIISIPSNIDDPEGWVQEQLHSVNLGVSCEQRKIF